MLFFNLKQPGGPRAPRGPRGSRGPRGLRKMWATETCRFQILGIK